MGCLRWQAALFLFLNVSPAYPPRSLIKYLFTKFVINNLTACLPIKEYY